MTSELKNTAANLQRDIDLLCKAFDSLTDSINYVQKHNSIHLEVTPSLDFAIWAHYRFAGDWNNFIAYFNQSLDNYNGDKRQLWAFISPNMDDHEPDADRHLDRMDVALHLICKELGMKMPFESVRYTSWHQLDHLHRVQAFIKGINDVVNPRNA